MANLAQNLHFVLFPLMAQGHTIPMVDIARLLAQRGAIVTIISTPLNALRFKATVTRSVQAGLHISVVELYFPSEEAGLPKGCENFDMLAALSASPSFFTAIAMLQEQLETFLENTKLPPSCIISDMCFPWTTNVAHKFHIPRLLFHGPGCFYLLSSHNIITSKVLDRVGSETENFVVPGIPDRIKLTKTKVIGLINPGDSNPMKEFYDQILESEKAAYGIVANTFEELEPEYVKEYKSKG